MHITSSSLRPNARTIYRGTRLLSLLALLAACSSGGTTSSPPSGSTEDASTEDGGTTTSGNDSGVPTTKNDDAGVDAAPPDPQVTFTVKLGGAPATVTGVAVSRDSPDVIEIKASLTQDSIPGGASGTPSIALSINTAAIGIGTCGSAESGKNVGVDLVYSKSGTVYFLGPQYQGGSCMMNVTRQANGTFTAGNVQGVAGGTNTIPFDITWAQKTPP
ncbi:MAG: hypothetical protein U0174_25610 [Polyangiaceae bacterium]